MPAGFTPPPSGNDWGAFAYGSPVPQPNGFVTGPDSSTDGNLAVFDGTTGNRIKDGGVPSGGGSYLVANTARVDPEGDDSTGTVGDLTKPFLTVQAAVTALEAGGPYTDANPAVVLLPTVDSTENVTTALERVCFVGDQFYTGNPAIGNLTVTASDAVKVGLSNLYVGDISAPNLLSGKSITVRLFSAIISGEITTTGSIYVQAPYNTGAAQFDITCGDGEEIHIVGLVGIPQDFAPPIINAPNGLVEIFNSIIADVTDADSIALFDSVLMANTSGVVPTVTDTLRNPATMDFSTLPQATSEPAIDTGRAWIDTTGGDNIVKVKL